jgi:prephenate dehydrogenase
MKNIKKILIIGVGFMGGSLSLALRKKFPKVSVWGFARSNKSFRKLKKLKILNRVEENLAMATKDADIVILAAPVEAIVDYLKKISPWLKKGAIVFDLGSSKKKIQQAASRVLPKSSNFVGCHPLAGSQKSGPESSQAGLYKGSLCLVTSLPSKKATKTVKNLWEKLGSKVVFISPDLHDKILSSISHLPHLVSFSLTESIPETYLKLAPESLKDLTRISGSPAGVWTDIFLSNKKNILKDLGQFIKTLKRYEILLKKSSKPKIARLINKANAKQKRIR